HASRVRRGGEDRLYLSARCEGSAAQEALADVPAHDHPGHHPCSRPIVDARSATLNFVRAPGRIVRPGPRSSTENEEIRPMRSATLLGAAIVALASGATSAGTISQPAMNPFSVPGNAAGDPVPFDVAVSGFSPGILVYLEQCDGTAPTAPGWSAT